MLAVVTRNTYSSILRFQLPASFPLFVPLVTRLLGAAAVSGAHGQLPQGHRASPLSPCRLVWRPCVVMVAAGVYAIVLSHFPP